MENPDKVHKVDKLLEKLWGPEYVGEPDLVKQFVYRLRTKLEPNPSEPQYFVTVRGSGYAFEPDTRPDLKRVPRELWDRSSAQGESQEAGTVKDLLRKAKRWWSSD